MISRRRPRQLRAQSTVAAILDAVSRILARDGIGAVTTNRIAEVAGVSIGSVYQYFPDKQAIYAALHERHADSMARLIESTLVAHAGRPPQKVLQALVETLVDAHAAEPQLHLVLAEVPHRAEGARSLAARLAGALRLALATDDVSALCLVPGVGRKTAQRLLVELKSRLGGSGDVDLRALDADGASPSAATGPSAHADVREALVGLGYGNEEIAGVVGQLPLDGDASDLLRQALQKLAVA